MDDEETSKDRRDRLTGAIVGIGLALIAYDLLFEGNPETHKMWVFGVMVLWLAAGVVVGHALVGDE